MIFFFGGKKQLTTKATKITKEEKEPDNRRVAVKAASVMRCLWKGFEYKDEKDGPGLSG